MDDLKTLLISLFGFCFGLFVEGFSRIIITFFHKTELSFFGTIGLPSTSWVIVIFVVSFVGSWLGSMLAFSFAKNKTQKVFTILLVIQILWIVFETLASFSVLPAWYLITFPITSILAIFTAKYTYQLNEISTNTVD